MRSLNSDPVKIALLSALLLGTLLPNFDVAVAAAGPPRISLAGTWRFALDGGDAGLRERWFEQTLPQRVMLPGSLPAQEIGNDITVDTKWTGDVGADRWLKDPRYEKYRQPGNIKIPFFLQPGKHYVGPAWYQREFHLPKAWTGRRVVLTLERAHWETRVWLDGRELGSCDSLCTPHVYDLGIGLAPGPHTLTLRVNNQMLVDIGSWSHSVSDHTQGNWNGIIGRIELSATSPVYILDAQVYPNPEMKCARVRVRLGNSTGQSGRGTLTADNTTQQVRWDATGGEIELLVALGETARVWDEFNPVLQTLEIRLEGPGVEDHRTVRFGLREIKAQGRQFLLNNRPVFFRGTLECCIFPRTGYPPTDVASWKRIIRICKAHGLNHIRFHSWCPPEAAFVAADELGFYFQVECGVWTNPGETAAVGEWIYAESERVVRAYGNHPSFVLFTHGNEPHGRNREEFLARWVNHWKQRDGRFLVTSGSAYPQLPENQYHVYYPCRGPHGWLGKDYFKDVQALDVPVIVHEMGQWCVYPNFDEIRKYTGHLKPRNFEIFRDSLREQGMLDQWRAFLHASGRLQALCYKEEIEAALRTPGIGGFQLLDLHDFPGQGTALVGVLDAFWDSKGYISAAEFRRFCNHTVPLARLLKRVWTTDETLKAEVELAHFGPKPLEDVVPQWKLVGADGKVYAQGELPRRTLPLGAGTKLGVVEAPLAGLPAPKACRLVVGLRGTRVENDWNLWVYPAEAPQPAVSPEKVLVTEQLDGRTLERLERGGSVLLVPRGLSFQHPRLGFTPIFWNRYMFNTQGRQTLGLLCDPKHPALARFPTEGFQDWQWEELVSGAGGIVMDSLPRELRPIIQVIDDWNTNRKLGLLFECRVGAGRLLVCSADLRHDLGKRPAARQLRASLLEYMASPRFAPKATIAAAELVALLQAGFPSRLATLGARVIDVSSEDTANGNVAANAVDGDPNTFWHTRWQPRNDPMPHHLVIDLGSEQSFAGIICLPRQDMANGRIAECEVYAGNDPKAWSGALAKARWQNTDQPQQVKFQQPVTARYLKLVIRSEVNRNPFASLAELDVLSDEKK